MAESKDLRDGGDSVYVEKVDLVSDDPEGYRKAGLTDEEARFLENIPHEQQQKIYHKVDLHLVPMLALLYLISHIDRANIGNAKIEGLEASLNMTGTDYNVALAIFFVPYVLGEVPSNMLLTKFKRPSYYIGTLVICWSIAMVLMGVVKNLAGLIAVRFVLGLFEAGFFFAAIHTVGQWYPPNKTQSRMAMFYCASATSGAFSGLLAAAIAKMDGLGNYEGWRWIFIIEGLISVIIGIACFFWLPDSPALSTGWLNPDEARFLELIHVATRGRKTAEPKKKFQWKNLWKVVKDWQIYLQAVVFMSNAVPNYGLKFTMPQIIKNMGFTSTKAQLLTAPPYAVGAISSIIAGLLADRFTWRMPFIVGSQALLVISYSILFTKAEEIADNVPLCYFAVFVACAGVYPILPGCNAWTINNLAGPAKRAIGIAAMISIGNCGGIIGSFIFIDKEKPKYPTGFGSSLAFASAGIVSALTLELLFWTINKKNERYTEEEIRAKYTEEELEEMGDRSPLFKYSL